MSYRNVRFGIWERRTGSRTVTILDRRLYILYIL
jgi:hypothetical protein